MQRRRPGEQEGWVKVVCTLGDIQHKLGATDAQLGRELMMDTRTISKLLADDEAAAWRLDRAQLHRLILFANSHGLQAFKIVRHPIWSTFTARVDEIAVFRGTRSSDAPIEEFLNRYLAQLGSHNVHLNIPSTPRQVEDAMTQVNCLFIGSPRAHPASEMALALLWGAEPFQDQSGNRARIPIQFLGMTPDHEFKSSALLRDGTWHGFELKTGSRQPLLWKVDWFRPEVYSAHRGSITDGAVLVACYQPLRTREAVTTIVIAGYTALSSMIAANEAAYRSLPDFDPQEAPGSPWYTAMKASYEKRGDQPRSTEVTQLVKDNSVEWTPPRHAP
jgi:hypothetical protein